MFKKLLLSLIVISSASAQSAQQVRFVVTDKNSVHEIQFYNVDPLIRNIQADKLERAMKYLVTRVEPLANGEYKLYAHVKGFGGGPISAGPAALAASATVMAGYIALCSAEGPVCVAHLPEFQTMASAAYNATYIAVFLCPWLP